MGVFELPEDQVTVDLVLPVFQSALHHLQFVFEQVVELGFQVVEEEFVLFVFLD